MSGIHSAKIISRGVNPEEYHSSDIKRGNPQFVMSSSQLRSFAECPARWLAGYEFPGSEATEWGSLVDCRLLTPEQFGQRYELKPKTYPDDAMECPQCGSVTEDSMSCRKCKCARRPIRIDKEWWSGADYCKAWVAERESRGISIITEQDIEKADLAIAALRADEIIATFLEASDKQVLITGVWHDDATGMDIPLQALVDLLPRPDTEFAACIGDLKTTRNARPLPWQRWAFTAGYHIQAAFYTDLVNQAENTDNGARNTFCFILSESFPPYQVGKRMGSQSTDNIPGFLEFGRMEYERMLANYCRCLKSGKWPGYDDTDEAVQGWSVVRPSPFDVERSMFAPKYEFGLEEEAPTGLQDPDDFNV